MLLPGEPEPGGSPRQRAQGHSRSAPPHSRATDLRARHHREHRRGLDRGPTPLGPLDHRRVLALTNGAQITGKIAPSTVERAASSSRSKNAQNAGAIAVLIADNVAGDPPRDWAAPIRRSSFPPAASRSPPATRSRPRSPEVRSTGTLELDLSILAGTDRVRGLMMLAAFNSGDPRLLDLPLRGGRAPQSAHGAGDQQRPHQLGGAALRSHLAPDDGRGLVLGPRRCSGRTGRLLSVPPRRPPVVIQSCVSTAPNTVFSDGCRTSRQGGGLCCRGERATAHS